MKIVIIQRLYISVIESYAMGFTRSEGVVTINDVLGYGGCGPLTPDELSTCGEAHKYPTTLYVTNWMEGVGACGVLTHGVVAMLMDLGVLAEIEATVHLVVYGLASDYRLGDNCVGDSIGG